MPVLHTIKAYLYKNVLTKDNPNDFIARTVNERSLNVKQICEAAVNRGGANITSVAMEHATELFFKEMAYQLCVGYSVNTGYFTAGTQIKGVFDSPVEVFNAEKHTILFHFNQAEKLRAEIQNIEIEILGVADVSSVIFQVTDLKSGTVNNLITPNRNLKLSGNKIKITGDNTANGVFFINIATNERTQIEINDVAINKPTEVMFIVPTLSAGNYRLELTTQFAGSSIPLKEPRTITFDKILTVQ